MRNRDIERLIRISQKDWHSIVDKLQKNILGITNIDEVHAKIKAILENLKSSLDFAARDIREYAGLPPTKFCYFPYSYPTPKKDPIAEFEKKIEKDFTDLNIKNTKIYQLLCNLQDQKWIKDFWDVVNPTKHDELPPISKRFIQIGDNVKIFGKLKNEGKIIVGDREITEKFEISPHDTIPENIRGPISQNEELYVNAPLLANLEIWLKEITDLLKNIYAEMNSKLEI
jgi:hypothetical protein